MIGRMAFYGVTLSGMVTYAMWPISEPVTTYTDVPDLTLIAHAGGGLPGATYSNSREALDGSVRYGFGFIEVDLELTKSDELVLLHGWEDSHYRYFSRVPRLPSVMRGLSVEQADTAEDFRARSMRGGLTPMSGGDLVEWMDRHPEVQIITDTKSGNSDILSRLAEISGPSRLGRITAQVYTLEGIDIARKLGYESIIFTAYKSKLPISDLVKVTREEQLHALTLPWQRIASDQQANLPDDITVYAHTVNNPKLAKTLVERGVDGVYTDYLTPSITP